MKNILFLAISYWLLTISFSSCTPQQRLQRLEDRHPELFKPLVKDSISTTIQYVTRDSILTIPGQIVLLHDTFLVNKPCPTHYSKTLKAGTETAILHIDSGRVTVICKDDSLKKEILLRDKIINNFKEHVKVGIAENDIYKIHWYDYFCRTVVAIALIILLLWIVLQMLLKDKIPLP